MDPQIKIAITELLAMFWDIFVKTEIPYFGINFGQLYIGLFASSVFVTFIHKTLDSEASYKSGKKDYVKEGKEDD